MITIFAPNFTFMHIEFAQIVKIATRHLVNNTGQIPNVPANPRTITEDEKKKKSSHKRNCIYIELNDCDELMIGNTMYSAGDSIDASDLRFYLDKQ